MPCQVLNAVFLAKAAHRAAGGRSWCWSSPPDPGRGHLCVNSMWSPVHRDAPQRACGGQGKKGTVVLAGPGFCPCVAQGDPLPSGHQMPAASQASLWGSSGVRTWAGPAGTQSCPLSPVACATPGPCIPWGSLSLGEGQPQMPGALRRCWGEVPYHIDNCSGILVSGSASEGAQPETPLSPQWFPELVLAPCICGVVYSSTVPAAFPALSPSPERVSATCSHSYKAVGWTSKSHKVDRHPPSPPHP